MNKEVIEMTENKQTTAEEQLLKAFKCLRLEVDGSIVNDIQLKFYKFKEEYAAQFQTTPSIDYEKEAELLSPMSSWYDINIIRNAYIKIYNQAFGKK